MSASLSDIYTVACAFLAASHDALEMTSEGAPEREYVSPGEPALDCCPELTVWTSLLGAADTVGPSSTAYGALAPAKSVLRGGVPLLTIHVQATRCVPTIQERNGRETLPSPFEMQSAARTLQEDVWALWLHLSAELRGDGSLAQVCSGAWRDGATALQQQGGCGGWQLVFRYPLEGGKLGT